MHQELPASRDWRSLTDLFKQNTIKPQKLPCCAIQIIEIIGLFLLSLPNKTQGSTQELLAVDLLNIHSDEEKNGLENCIHFEVKQMSNLCCFLY